LLDSLTLYLFVKIIRLETERAQWEQRYLEETAMRQVRYLKRGFFMYAVKHCFICRPSDSTVSEDAVIDPRTCWDFGIDSERAYQRRRIKLKEEKFVNYIFYCPQNYAFFVEHKSVLWSQIRNFTAR
jgi:hypothetical protein